MRARPVLAIVIASALAGCGQAGGRLDPKGLPPRLPFVIVHRFPGFSLDAVSGLVAAVWADGRIIRATGEDQIGESYVEGQLTAKQVASLVHMLEQSRLTTPADDMLIVDAASEYVYVRLPDGVLERAESVPHDRLTPIAALKAYLLSTSIGKETVVEGQWQIFDLPKEWFE